MSEGEIDVLLVTGSRDAATDEWASTIRDFLMKTRPLVLIHGDAKGIDRIAKEQAEKIGLIGIEDYPAEWSKWERLGKREWAGPIRNQEMLDRLMEYADWGKRVHVLAVHPDLPKSKGTKHMVGIARKRGVDITVIDRPIREESSTDEGSG